MIEKLKHSSKYTPERIKELVDRMTTLRQRWLASISSRASNKLKKTRPPGGSGTKVATIPAWPVRP
jgi:lysyl-tRNA synthetase class II